MPGDSLLHIAITQITYSMVYAQVFTQLPDDITKEYSGTLILLHSAFDNWIDRIQPASIFYEGKTLSYEDYTAQFGDQN